MLLLGREAERARVEELLGAARKGKSDSLLIQGMPGVGKSTLLQLAAELAGGFTVLAARGLESDAELPFSGLADLFRPVRPMLERIPPPQASALAGALALGPPVSGDRFAVYAATFSLLVAAADQAPVLAIVDDLHWLDSASAEALRFVTHRLGEEGIVILFARRDGEPMRVDFSGIPELTIGGLDPTDAVQLLQSTADRPVASSVAHAIAVGTAGNPLALTELPSLLSDSQLAGNEPLPQPPPVGQELERAFMRRVSPLSANTRTALLVAAASESGEMATIVPALQCLRLDPSHLEQAEAAGLITVDGGRLAFRHPLLRSAIYHTSPAGERRAAHRALAAALERDARGRSSRAWHLAAAGFGPDDDVAGLLEQAADEARSRSGYGAAASALERAARLSTTREETIRRLIDAGEAARFAGQVERALALLEMALSLNPDAIARGKIHLLRGQILMWRHRPMEAYQLLVDEAERVTDHHAALAVTMLLEAVGACWMDGRVVTGLETARRAYREGRLLGGPTEATAAAVLGEALLIHGDATEAMTLLASPFDLLLAQRSESERLIEQADAAFCLMVMERYAEAREILAPALRYSRERTLLGLLPYPLCVLAELEFRTGHWDAAYAAGTESLRLAIETGQDVKMSYSLLSLVRIEAARGMANECHAHAAQALERAATFGTGQIPAILAAMGLLEFGAGNYEVVIDHLDQVRQRLESQEMRETNVIPFAANLIEACIRTGRLERAGTLLQEFEDRARRTERNWALATVARCRGLLAEESDFEAYFLKGLTLHRRTPTPFEEARTELCFGEMLRRNRRRVEAREHLRTALNTFERLGAQPWANRARAELVASGEHARSRKAPATNKLTPAELQVALVIAEGNSNQDAAARLFLSPRTIETHLTSVYAKLGIRSRLQLGRLFAAEEPSLALSIFDSTRTVGV